MTWQRTRLSDCDECEDHIRTLGWAFAGACASVGIERGKSTARMASEYIQDYHERGHRK